ncbi:signal recognition particle-docking protein FtsY [Neorhizobium galegae]|uniref:signal recognition particle-docking protein FtsY n=1 Tax=Neorhizobium galegae TaxID=399 RepID=UPI000621A359|nr:signal recognition particle-docking protein FtsY [Neorhizobium galegae]CDZ27170.1 Signal recognition particle receptor FtsY [Neorhizobium galegae bv. officinalis]KAA9385015.1 signal recognition particle-docking protein FtsY [Neorhizobium galegae]KAB1110645.1 signal recognition particle-docking protein FtsY [Neorhizobium galegae]MCM2497748.1 signal recognition particle-docking protein FtsY [Neorhizobium galegae]MCQ1773696.1 signal recognition particle-docking protein FtsY [Neorhizobium galeg
MALGFIKRVFTFGKPAEEPVPDAGRPEDVAAIQAELEPKSRDEDLPVSPVDPVAPAEIETAGGPVSDVAAENVDLSEVETADDDETALLSGVEAASDIGMVPLSLLQAEAEAEEDAVGSAEAPPSVLSDISPSRGEITDEPPLSHSTDSVAAADSKSVLGQGATHDSISPLEGEMSGRTEGGEARSAEQSNRSSESIAATNALSQSEGLEPPPEPTLPRGFSTARPEPTPEPVAPQPKLTWFQRLRAGLARTSSQLTGQISALFTKRKLDDDTLEQLEDLLIQADLGVETAMRVTGALSSERYGKDVTGEDVSRIMAAEITRVLAPVAKPLALDLNHKPHVILVVGVNGTGKTTTIGKLAAKLSGSGLKVMLAAGDTFRAAAIEQLKIWADRTGSGFIGTKLGADAAGLAYDAYEQARANKSDVLIIDTAGRLQNRTELMAELEKIVRVLGKLDPDAPHTVLQTLDATTGQNAMNQVEIFRNVAGVSGLIMTKLDGTARGGILVAIAAKHKLPVYFIGVGEGVDDLEPFEAQDFARAIAGIAH